MGKARKKISKRLGNRCISNLGCGTCSLLRLFRFAGVFGDPGSHDTRNPKSVLEDGGKGRMVRGRLDCVPNRYTCPVHGDVE